VDIFSVFASGINIAVKVDLILGSLWLLFKWKCELKGD